MGSCPVSEEGRLALVQASGLLPATPEADACVHRTACPWERIHLLMFMVPVASSLCLLHSNYRFLSAYRPSWPISIPCRNFCKLQMGTGKLKQTFSLYLLQNVILPFLFYWGQVHSKKTPSPSWVSSYLFLKGEAGIRLQLVFQNSCFYPAVPLLSRSLSQS